VQQVQHKGLYLDKFLPGKREKGQKKEQEDPQADALRALGGSRCDTAVYKLAYGRWRDYWMNRGESVVCREGVVRDRLAIGLGMESVLENGVRLQHAYGTPLIPGSSLKGVLRRGLAPEHRDEQREDRRNVEWFLFGSTKREGAARFHDAWWVPDSTPPLALDVLTPHHQDYMQYKGPPTDFDAPIPVQFLTVRGSFLFVVETPNASWKKYLDALLRDVLRREGIGAKRSAGYGVIDVRA
jgi:CRISPR-associated protein Cmr6